MKLPTAGLAIALLFSSTTVLAQRPSPSGWVEDGKESIDDSSRMESAPAAPIKTPGGKMILQGGIEHATRLPMLPHKLQVGEQFHDNYLQSNPALTEWYWIPDWLAGKWRRQTETIISSYNYDTGQKTNESRTITSNQIADFGVQVDRKGGIWHCNLATAGIADCGSYLSIALVKSQEPARVSEQEVVIRDVFIQIHVNKNTRAIIFSAQGESLTRYKPAGNGRIESAMSVKSFDAEGNPMRKQKNLSYDQLTEPFRPLSAYKGQDLKQQFVNYLQGHGLADLIP